MSKPSDKTSAMDAIRRRVKELRDEATQLEAQINEAVPAPSGQQFSNAIASKDVLLRKLLEADARERAQGRILTRGDASTIRLLHRKASLSTVPAAAERHASFSITARGYGPLYNYVILPDVEFQLWGVGIGSYGDNCQVRLDFPEMFGKAQQASIVCRIDDWEQLGGPLGDPVAVVATVPDVDDHVAAYCQVVVRSNDGVETPVGTYPFNPRYVVYASSIYLPIEGSWFGQSINATLLDGVSIPQPFVLDPRGAVAISHSGGGWAELREPNASPRSAVTDPAFVNSMAQGYHQGIPAWQLGQTIVTFSILGPRGGAPPPNVEGGFGPWYYSQDYPVGAPSPPN